MASPVYTTSGLPKSIQALEELSPKMERWIGMTGRARASEASPGDQARLDLSLVTGIVLADAYLCGIR
jgi:hypothetical protein